MILNIVNLKWGTFLIDFKIERTTRILIQHSRSQKHLQYYDI